ncbi:hypothetical protein [Alteraurantiacibacter palmitatis]|uniref:Antifreeze protein n=1 Tax=Alteraurantiacibacter palmitatis TaxID=2054628 RepID=A0ABV7ECK2_9SPHN
MVDRRADGNAVARQGDYPFAIRAQFLREWQDGVMPGQVPGFELMPDTPDTGETPQARKKAWRQADLKRAIGAARQAGLQQYRVEIGPDGTIAIVVGAASPDGAVEAFRQD